ncbi:MAG TPA: YeeE/YedE family protein [Gammaproteobacteria bacterium]|nr:YeeE/YedE family protein [Gammaproteobacteria bacterium]
MDELLVAHVVALWGFGIALAFGMVANKTQFCTMGALSDWVNFGSLTRLRAWLLAMAVAIALSQAMQLMGWIDLSTAIYRSSNFGWLGNSVGGLLFGIGMTLGSGCGQRTLVRVGGGNLKSLVVLLVLGITAYMTLRGLLAVVRIEVFQRTNLDLAPYGVTDQGLTTLLAYVLDTEPWIVSVTVSALVVLTLLWFVFKDGAFRASGENMLVGAALGLLVASAWYVTGVIGFDDFDPVPFESVTFIAPVGNAINYLMTWTGSTIGFGIAVVFGIPCGSLFYALASGGFRIETFSDRADMINHLIAGVLMGFGGVLALGCTVGQGVAGISTLSVGAILATGAIMLGSVVTAKVQYHMLDESFSKSLRRSLAELRLLPGAVK